MLEWAYLGSPAFGVGLQVLPQADEGDEQGGRLKEAHVVDVHALPCQRTAVHRGDDGVDVGGVGAQGHQDVHVGGAAAQRAQRARVEVPPDDELQWQDTQSGILCSSRNIAIGHSAWH